MSPEYWYPGDKKAVLESQRNTVTYEAEEVAPSPGGPAIQLPMFGKLISAVGRVRCRHVRTSGFCGSRLTHPHSSPGAGISDMRRSSAAIILVAIGLHAAGTSLSAQHATAFDIEDGGRAFRNTCANCHGPDGDQIAGIDLGRGQFRRPLTDQELVGIIRKGIPDTPMPATNVSEAQAVKIVAIFVRLLSRERALRSRVTRRAAR